MLLQILSSLLIFPTLLHFLFRKLSGLSGCESLKHSIAVLVSAGIELTFFPVAGTVLWFGSIMRMMLVTH